jgi:hypothetical protein
MVLKGRDYGFIRLKLKDLIFDESGKQRARGIHRLTDNGLKEMWAAAKRMFLENPTRSEFEEAQDSSSTTAGVGESKFLKLAEMEFCSYYQ